MNRWCSYMLLIIGWISLYFLRGIQRLDGNAVESYHSVSMSPNKLSLSDIKENKEIQVEQIQNQTNITKNVPFQSSTIQNTPSSKIETSTQPLPKKILPTTPTDELDDIPWSWEDGDVDYKQISKNIIKRFSKLDRNTRFIVYKASPVVGFGNQFRAFCSVFLMAVVSGRRLRIDWDDYFKLMDSPFIQFKYNEEELKPFRFRHYYEFSRGFCNHTRYQSHDVDVMFGNRNLLFSILSDISCLVLPNPAYREVLQSLGFDITNPNITNLIDYESDRILRRQIARLLFTPNAEITRAIRSNLVEFERPVVGLQVRTGGYTARTHEHNKFLGLSSLQYFHKGIAEIAETNGWKLDEITVFISTDSNQVNTLIYQHNRYKKVINGVGFQRGHSSPYLVRGSDRMEFMKQAFLDLVLLSQTDHIIYTSGSSYGKLGMRLSLNKTARAVCSTGLCT